MNWIVFDISDLRVQTLWKHVSGYSYSSVVVSSVLYLVYTSAPLLPEYIIGKRECLSCGVPSSSAMYILMYCIYSINCSSSPVSIGFSRGSIFNIIYNEDDFYIQVLIFKKLFSNYKLTHKQRKAVW